MSSCATSPNKATNNQAEIERITPEQLAKILPAPVAYLSLEDIIKLSQNNTPSDVLIQKISASNSRYELTPSQTLLLNQQGVDAKVLDYIHTSNEAAKQNAVADELNKREKAKQLATQQLKREQMLELNRSYNGFYDPFYPGGFYPYGLYPFGYAPFGFGYHYFPYRGHHRR